MLSGRASIIGRCEALRGQKEQSRWEFAPKDNHKMSGRSYDRRCSGLGRDGTGLRNSCSFFKIKKLFISSKIPFEALAKKEGLSNLPRCFLLSEVRW